MTDGRRFYYGLIDTRPPGDPSQRCGEGRGCRWELASGRVKEIFGNQARTARALSTDGRSIAFAAGKTVRLLDLRSGAQRTLRRAATQPVGVSVLAGRVVWAEGRRIVTARA